MITNTEQAGQNLANQLSQFAGGSDEFYRHALNQNVTYTSGVRHFAQHAGGGAYWLLDILSTEPAILKEAQEFAVVTLTAKGGKATLVVTDGGKGDVPVTIYTRELDYTDCPDGEWVFYFKNLTLMLPDER